MAGYISIGIVLFMALVEITPIKINPISWLGKHFNKELSNKIDTMQSEVKELKITTDMNDIDAVRSRIISNDMLIRKGEHLTLYQYNSIFKDITKWKNYHNDYPELNGMINAAIENIESAYKKEKFN